MTRIPSISVRYIAYAAMAELVDALDSGSSRGNSVDVRVILAAISNEQIQKEQVRNEQKLYAST